MCHACHSFLSHSTLIATCSTNVRESWVSRSCFVLDGKKYNENPFPRKLFGFISNSLLGLLSFAKVIWCLGVCRFFAASFPFGSNDFPTSRLVMGLPWVFHSEEDFLRSGKWAETILSRLYGHSTWKWHESCGMEWERGDLVVNQIPSWERSHIPLKPSPFESMIFRTSRLVGYVIVPWRVCVLSLLLPENHGNFPYFWWDVGSLGVRVLKHYPNMNNMIGFCRSIWYGWNQDLDVFIW